MNRHSFRMTVVSIGFAVLSLFGPPPTVWAQSSAVDSQASNAATTKAQRKESRKQARQKKSAELKKLEANGYNPAARDDINYPDDLQNAQKKAARADAASR